MNVLCFSTTEVIYVSVISRKG